MHYLRSLSPHQGGVCPSEHWVVDKPRSAALSDELALSHYSPGAVRHTHFSSWSEEDAAVGAQGAGTAQEARVRGHVDRVEGGNDEKGGVGDVRYGGVGREGTLARKGGNGDLEPAGYPLPSIPE